MKQLDPIDQLKLLDDTPQVVEMIREHEHISEVRIARTQLQQLWIVARKLSAEVRRLRKT